MNLGILKPPLGDRDHIQGPRSAPLELLEYGDFQCPHCQRASIVVTQLMQELGDQLRFSFRHFPLTKMHPLARPAALASEAASLQNKFWEMHDLLFENSGNLQPADILSYAKRLELDLKQFESDFTSEAVATRIQEDISSGIRSGVNGTPTFFINGVRHNAGNDLESLKAGLTG